MKSMTWGAPASSGVRVALAIAGLAGIGGAQKTSLPEVEVLQAAPRFEQRTPRQAVQYLTPTITSHEALTGEEILTVDVGEMASWDLIGDADNVVLTIPLSEGDLLTGVGWDVSLATVGSSWLSEATFYLDGSDLDEMGVFLTPGAGDDESGAEFYSSLGIVDLGDAGIPDVPILADGNLFIELHETFDDFADNIDANWVGASTLTLAIQNAPTDCTPKILGGTFTPGFAQETAVSGNYAFVADFDEGLQVVDISDPLMPEVVAAASVSGLAMAITIHGDTAYVVSQPNGAGSSILTIFDISDPLSPTQLGLAGTPGQAFDVVFDGFGLALIADGSSGLSLLEVQNPSTPRFMGSIDTDGLAIGVDFDSVEGVAYIADQENGLVSIELGMSTQVLDQLDTGGLATGVKVSGATAYVATFSGGVVSVDISDPTALSILDTENTPGFADDIEISGDRAYVASRTAGLHVLDIMDPSNLAILGTIDTPSSASGLDVAASNNLVASPSFESGGPAWTQFSTNFGTPLCTLASCGAGGGTGPNTGDWWCWFGGIAAPEIGSVSQEIEIPQGSVALTFQLEIPAASGNGTDFMEVSIDGDVLATYLESDGPYVGYELQVVDISAYADGGSHTLEFASEITGSAVTNFFVDDVAILAGGNIVVADFQSGVQVIEASSCDPFDNDECFGAILIACDTTIIADNSDATTAVDDPLLSCYTGGPDPGFNTIWYRFQPNSTSVRVHTEGSLPPADDSLLGIYSGSCGSLTEIACSEDEGTGLLSDVTVNGLTPGDTYYIMLSSFGANDVGEYMLTLECLPDPTVFNYNGTGINEDLLEATEVTIGMPWTATLTPRADRDPGPWVILLRPMDAAGPIVDLGTSFGLAEAGLSETLVSGGMIADFLAPAHSGGGTSEMFGTTVPNIPGLVGSDWFIQAIVVGDLPDAAGGLGVFDPRFSSAVGGTVQSP